MPTSFPYAQIDRFKRKAKQLCRANSITHSQALDRIAVAHGYSNWSLLMKHSDTVVGEYQSSSLPTHVDFPLKFTRTTEEMQQAQRKIQKSRGFWNSPEEWKPENICFKFISAPNAVDFAVDYMTCLLTVPRFRISGAAKTYKEMRRWLPYAAEPIEKGSQVLVNRHYKPVGLISNDFVRYEEFPHLQTALTSSGLNAIAHRRDSNGYLFNDGCPPWRSRKAAEQYLARLHILQTILTV